MVECLARIVPGMDGEIAKTFQRTLKKQGMKFPLSAKGTGAETTKSRVALSVEPAKGGEAQTLEADVVLVAIGRRPNTEGLGLERAGVALDKSGRIQIDGRFQTNIPGIYAIGDVIAGPMLAHKAGEEGVAVAEMRAGRSAPASPAAITQPGPSGMGTMIVQVGPSVVANTSITPPLSARPMATGASEYRLSSCFVTSARVVHTD